MANTKNTSKILILLDVVRMYSAKKCAPMSWKVGSDFEDTDFKEEVEAFKEVAKFAGTSVDSEFLPWRETSEMFLFEMLDDILLL